MIKIVVAVQVTEVNSDEGINWLQIQHLVMSK